MRLLNTETHRLREFSGEPFGSKIWRMPDDIPPYAILSHCWSKGEVVFQDIQHLDRARGMAGFPKIENCCNRALKIGYKWVWVDTCCIDKTSSAELSEAINSMFKWYSQAGTCLVYLEDVEGGDPHHQDSSFRKSRWFTRGWTLQELVVPKRILFFSKSWSFLGTKDSLMGLIRDITKIPIDALSHRLPFSSFSIAQRMSWAAKRTTTRVEDQAYSLLGLFDIFMPIIYGEGNSAFRRLQLEIIQRSSDQTIFAWSSKWSTPYLFPLPLDSNVTQNDTASSNPSIIVDLPSQFQIERSSILAPSPADFLNSGNVVPLSISSESQERVDSEYTWTHLGLRICMPLIPVRMHDSKGQTFIGMLSCWNSEEQRVCGIILQRDGKKDPYRCYDWRVSGSGVSDSSSHLVFFPKMAFDEISPKLAVFGDTSKEIYITNRLGLRDNGTFYPDPPPHPNRWDSRVRLSIVFPHFILARLEERGFSLSGYACKHKEDSQDMKLRKDLEGDLLLEFQLTSHGTVGPGLDPTCPTTCANLLFFNNSTKQAFSVFIGHSRRGLLDSFFPRITIDVKFHRPEEFSTLEAEGLCQRYDHHDYHDHTYDPVPIVRRNRRMRLGDRPGFIRRCQCHCDQDREATTVTIFGDHRRGLSVTSSVWREYEDEGNVTYCSVWMELSLRGRIYDGLTDCDDEDEARSDIAEWGSVRSDGGTEDEPIADGAEIDSAGSQDDQTIE